MKRLISAIVLVMSSVTVATSQTYNGITGAYETADSGFNDCVRKRSLNNSWECTLRFPQGGREHCMATFRDRMAGRMVTLNDQGCDQLFSQQELNDIRVQIDEAREQRRKDAVAKKRQTPFCQANPNAPICN